MSELNEREPGRRKFGCRTKTGAYFAIYADRMEIVDYRYQLIADGRVIASLCVYLCECIAELDFVTAADLK